MEKINKITLCRFLTDNKEIIETFGDTIFNESTLRRILCSRYISFLTRVKFGTNFLRRMDK